jgi:hypothetical protein
VTGDYVRFVFFSRWVKDFAAGRNVRSQKFYRIINEVPTLLMVLIVILVAACCGVGRSLEDQPTLRRLQFWRSLSM